MSHISNLSEEKHSTECDDDQFDFDTWIIESGLETVKDAFIAHKMTTVDTININHYASYNSLLTHHQVFNQRHLVPTLFKAIQSLHANTDETTSAHHQSFDFDAWVQKYQLDEVKDTFIKHGLTSLNSLYMDNNPAFVALVTDTYIVQSGLVPQIITAINSLQNLRKNCDRDVDVDIDIDPSHNDDQTQEETDDVDTKHDVEREEDVNSKAMRKNLKQFDDLREEYKTMSEEYEQKKQENADRIKQYADRRRSALDKATEKVTTNMDTLQTLMTTKRNLLNAKIDEYKREIDRVEENQRAKQKKVDMAINALNELIQQETEYLKQSLDSCEQLVRKLHDNGYDTDQQTKRAQELQTLADSVRERFDAKMQDIEQMKRKINEFVHSKPVEDIEEEKEMCSVRVNYALLDDIRNDIGHYVTIDGPAAKKSKEKTISDLSEMNHAMQLQVINVEREKKELVSKHEAQQKEIHSLESHIRSLEQEKDTLTATTAEQHRELEAVKAEQQQLHALNAENQKKIQQFERDITTKDTQIQELWDKSIINTQNAKRRHSTLAMQIAASAQKSKAFESSFEDLIRRNEKLKKNKIDLESANRKLTELVNLYAPRLELISCDEKTGVFAANEKTRDVVSNYCGDWTFLQIAAYYEDRLEHKNDSFVPWVHIWCRFKDLKSLYLVDTPKIRVEQKDLDGEEQEVWREVPDDRLRTKLKELASRNIVLGIECRRKDGTWPRAMIEEQSQTLRVGDIIDVMDDRNDWFESVIRRVNLEERTFVVHYIGWVDTFDEELRFPEDKQRIAKRHTHTKGSVAFRHKPESFKQFQPIDIKQAQVTQIKSHESEQETKHSNTENQKLQSEVNSQQQHIEKLKEINMALRKQVAALCAVDNAKLDENEEKCDATETTLSPRGGLVGLQNLGNTCFMNSIIQCLAHLPKLAGFFLITDPHKRVGSVSMAFGNLLKCIWNDNDIDSLALPQFKRAMASVAPKYGQCNMQDPAEFLDYLLNALHDELNEAANATLDHNENDKIEANGMPDDMIANISWQCYTKNNKSKIIDLFYGQEKSTTICANRKCRHSFVIFEPFKVLHLSTTFCQKSSYFHIGKKWTLSLKDCIEDYVAEKTMHGKWFCQQCNRDLPGAKERVQLFTFPKILVIHLKKNEMQNKSKQPRVNYPVWKLDLSAYNAGPKSGPQPIYDLYSVSCLSGYHCTAYARGHKHSNKFFHFSDASIREVKQKKDVVAQNAFLLFYQRRD